MRLYVLLYIMYFMYLSGGSTQQGGESAGDSSDGALLHHVRAHDAHCALPRTARVLVARRYICTNDLVQERVLRYVYCVKFYYLLVLYAYAMCISLYTYTKYLY